MPRKMVVISPLVAPCPESEKRLLDCDDGVLVTDIRCALARCLNVPQRSLSVVKHHETGLHLVLNGKEVPSERLQVKGVKSLSALPNVVQVSRPPQRSTMTKEEALAIQQDTIDAYQDELLAVQLKTLQDLCAAKWVEEGRYNSQDYTTRLRDIVQPRQAAFFPKWGFEPNQKGFVAMQTLFNLNFASDPDVQENVNRINSMVGTDMAWVGEIEDERVRDALTNLMTPPPAAIESEDGGSNVGHYPLGYTPAVLRYDMFIE